MMVDSEKLVNIIVSEKCEVYSTKNIAFALALT